MSPITKHTLVSCIINAIFSIVFFSLFYSGESALALGQMSTLTIDFLPQAFFVGLFSTLPTSILTRNELRTGKVTPSEGLSLPLPVSLLPRVMVLSILSLIVFGGAAVFVLNFVEPFVIGFTAALVVKAGFGVLVSLFVAPVAVMAALIKRESVS